MPITTSVASSPGTFPTKQDLQLLKASEACQRPRTSTHFPTQVFATELQEAIMNYLLALDLPNPSSSSELELESELRIWAGKNVPLE